MDTLDRYKSWCARTDLTDQERAELKAMEKDDLAMTRAFGQTLSFGTAGLRGIMGMGTNCINRFTIGAATAGIAEWLKAAGKAGASVALSTDSRLGHEAFARETASILAAAGFTVLLWQTPAPTPVLSWTVRHFGCAAGIMITASHNPRTYNGYKAYNSRGCQLLKDDADAVTACAAPYFAGQAQPQTGDFQDFVSSGAIRLLEGELDDYLKEVADEAAGLLLYGAVPEDGPIKDAAPRALDLAEVRIGLTPLHGVGGLPVKRALEDAGFTVLPVESQFQPDGHFPTIATPNPELAVAFDELYKLADQTPCDLLIATDPDCDRVGIAVPDGRSFKRITGNQLGALLIDYIGSLRQARPGDTVVTTTVTSSFGKAVAKARGFDVSETFTGFKYIGSRIDEIIDDPARTFVFGYEESYGYLFGTHARDKDAVVTALLCALMARRCKEQGISILDRLQALYDETGYVCDVLINQVFDPIPGRTSISDLFMKDLRQDPAETFGGLPIKQKIDYIKGFNTFSKENVIQYRLNGDSVISFRPSGTEPKLKCYISARGTTPDEARALGNKLERAFHERIAQISENEGNQQ
jgi:phosphoglucomutase